jgi:hypothetical protein
MVALRRPQINFSCPKELHDSFQAIADRLGDKQKWVVGAAGILLLLEQPDERLQRLLDLVGATNINGKWAELISLAKTANKKPGGKHFELTGALAISQPKEGPTAKGPPVRDAK